MACRAAWCRVWQLVRVGERSVEVWPRRHSVLRPPWDRSHPSVRMVRRHTVPERTAGPHVDLKAEHPRCRAWIALAVRRAMPLANVEHDDMARRVVAPHDEEAAAQLLRNEAVLPDNAEGGSGFLLLYASGQRCARANRQQRADDARARDPQT